MRPSDTQSHLAEEQPASIDDARMPSACVMVVQMGARRNYTYARQLEEAGLLHSLICDAAWSGDKPPLPMRVAGALSARSQAAVARRRVVGVPPARVRASIAPLLAQSVTGLMNTERGFAFQDDILGAQVPDTELEGVRAIVSYQGNGGNLLTRARRLGVKIATDFIITPRQWEIEAGERERWQGWEAGRLSPDMPGFYRQRIERIMALSDLYFCPSPAVAEDLAGLRGFVGDKVRILPYGASGVVTGEARPQPGRVLFAGAAGLRKGLPYLAQAAALLQAQRSQVEIVVAGAATPGVRSRPETSALTFLGHLGRDEMAQAYAAADLFCLPSLAEGSATSIFEALAHGLPVVTTKASGSVVRDGVEGFIVPERNGAAIAEAVSQIVSDRNLRSRMSAAARKTARCYSDERTGRAFVAAVRELLL